MKNSKRHNSIFIDTLQKIDIYFLWHIPMIIMRDLFSINERKSVRLIKHFKSRFVSWWLNPLESATIFRRKPCRRNLCYIGCTWCPEENKDNDPFFKIGKVYESTTFNGGTYTINGYEQCIGYAYFEIV
jgi:hypothetical protein